MSTLIPKFKQDGTGAVNRDIGDKLREVVSVLDFGVVSGVVSGDALTANTAAINAAIASGKDIHWPAGTYYTTGGHRLSTNRQRMFGSDGATIKRASGTTYLLDTTQGAEVVVENLIFDGNSLAGSLIIWRGHYSKLDRIKFKNNITNYPLWLSGCNVSQFNDLDFGDSCFGGILFDSYNDVAGGSPSYACLYSTFTRVICGTTSGGSSIKFAPSNAVINVNFNECVLEADNGAATSAIDLDAQLQKNIEFNQLRSEYASLGAYPYINVRGDESVNIQFNGGYWVSNAANTAEVVRFGVLCRNVGIRNVHFSENPSTPSLAGRTLVSISAVRNGVFENNDFQFKNNFYFLRHDAGGASSYITDRSNIVAGDATFTGAGTNTIDGVDHLTIEHSNLTLTLANCTYVNLDNNNTTAGVNAPGSTVTSFSPAFEVRATSLISNVTGDGTLYTMVFGSEVFDTHGDFDGTSTFTAPISGRYQFSWMLTLEGSEVAQNYGRVRLVTSNRTYVYANNFGAGASGGAGGDVFMTGAILADMQEGDTAYLDLLVAGGTKSVDVAQGSYFAGFLVK